MAKRKAETASLLNDNKKAKHKTLAKPNLLDDSDSEGSSDDSGGGARLEGSGFKINEEYAKRFEHNKKREELQTLEEKYQKLENQRKVRSGDETDEDSESSSDDEDEDDDGFLATEALDAEISATLQAIRSKDPRLYDEKATFYAPIEEDEGEEVIENTTDKPMYLSDYHRTNLLKGYTGAEEEEVVAPRSFAEEQNDLKRSLVKEMHAAADDSGEDDNEDGGFLVPKEKPQKPSGMQLSKTGKFEPNLDVAAADKDPETYLSNFMAARAWVPADDVHYQPMESDDEDDDERTEKFETAYNLRFEKPEGSNETLKAFARNVVAATSVRREDPNNRKRQRDAKREKKETEKKEREEGRARLRRLKIEEMEGKLQKIKNAAGLRSKGLKDEDWSEFLGDNWDNDKWEVEMTKRFGKEYYAEPDEGFLSESDIETGSKKKRQKKPKWDDDIDIKDLIPEYVDQDTNEIHTFGLPDSEGEDEDRDEAKNKTSKDRQQERLTKKKAARLERGKIEALVDDHMDIDLPAQFKQTSLFRYRETSPTSFGLTARDILMAPDSQLNQFAGLKKMASFRDADKKRRDKKSLGKKARLRQWRKETFGDEDGPKITVGAAASQDNIGVEDVDIVGANKKKKKRSRKNKAGASLET